LGRTRATDESRTLITMGLNWRFSGRKGLDTSVLGTGTDFQPDFVSEGSLKFALEKSGNDSGPSYRKMLFPYMLSLAYRP
jgi:hypothetical protein